MLSLGGGGGARLRLAALAHQARLDEGAQGLDRTPGTTSSSQPTIPQVSDGVRAKLAEGNTEIVLDVIDGLPLEPAEEGEAMQESGHLAPPVIDVCWN